MRILIASDIHGRVEAMKKLLAAIKLHEPDEIWLLGDVLYHGPRNGVPSDYEPMEVAKMLNPLASRIKAVRGNCDAEVDQMVLDYSFYDNSSLSFELDGHLFFLEHGHLNQEKCGDVRLYGHTHLYELKKEDGIVTFNSGSIGFPKGGNPATYGLYEDGRISLLRLDDHTLISSLELD